jgi:hypothetical protein
MAFMGRTPLILLSFALALSACSGDKKDDAGAADSGVPADTGEPPDSGIVGFPDAEPAETGPLPCIKDQGGEALRGCDPGEVCNLAMDPPQCVPGVACMADTDCNRCADLQNPQDCGHGFNVVAFCDMRHAHPNGGGTCTRSRAPCEPCTEDVDCGRVHPLLGGSPSRCLPYDDGNKYCGRPCGSCPDGFVCDSTSSQCRRLEGCAEVPEFCPPDNMTGPTCAGTDQICPGEECPGTGGAKCSTNNQPGAIGICIGFCESNADCPSATPVCNPRNGICITGCTKDSCAAGLTCHVDGFCHAPCEDNAACETQFGADTYCNEPGQPPPRYFKSYHDTNSCQRLGCEEKTDCAVAGVVCDKTIVPPECVRGCFEESDCTPGEACKSTGGFPPLPSYNRDQCRALDDIAMPSTGEIGVCCNPGCRDRNLQCQINEFCCGEPGSPYAMEASCLALTSTGGPQAEPGQCFEMPVPDPWCHPCTGEPGQCMSGYTPGFNVDPNINGGQPFQEQEFCRGISADPQIAICGVTCNPNSLDDNQCPRGWTCRPVFPGCLQDADCNGLECVGEVLDDPNTMPNEEREGRCKCGENGVATAACPQAYARLNEGVTYPRCVDIGNTGMDLFCIASYQCEPPAARPGLYPEGCGFGF